MARQKKLWSVRIGSRGAAVTVFERKSGGPLSLRWWVSETPTEPGHHEWRALNHNDRAVAEQTARELSAVLLASTIAGAQGKATVAEVLGRYTKDVTDHLKGQGPKEAKRRAAIWLTFLGATRDAGTIDFPTIDRFTRERRAGAITIEGYELKASPSDRAIGADIEYLMSALNHAGKVMRPAGGRLLALNPLRGYAVPKNKNPRRPVATYDRYLKVIEHADTVDPQKLFGPFMGLVEALGWRVSAICQLRRSDVDLKASPSAPHGRIHKTAATDKEGVDMWLPLSESARLCVDRILSVNPSIYPAWPLFPAPLAKQNVEHVARVAKIPKSWSRYHARTILHRAEKAAGLEEVAGGDFHPYRRKWSTERKHLSPKDVAAAGGWRDLRTLERSYTQVDAETLLAVVSEPRKLREAKTGEAG